MHFHFSSRFILPAFFLLAGLPTALSAQTTAAPAYGIVSLSANFMREKPDYDQELGNQALMGTVVTISDKQGYWLKITSPDPYTAWVNEKGIALKTQEEIRQWLLSDRVICVADYTHVYRDADPASPRISDLSRGGILGKRTGKNGRALKKKGYLGVALPDGRTGWVRKQDAEDLRNWVDSRQLTQDNIVREALRYVGMPYLWGGAAVGGLDCSGLTRMVFYMNGLLLPRNASQQARCGMAIDTEGVRQGDYSSLERGDLLFFGNRDTGRVSHVGIYLGGARMVHASQVVRVNSLDPSQEDYYENAGRLLFGRRIAGHEKDFPGTAWLRESPFYFPN